MRQRSLRIEHGRSIGADAEERGASEIEDAGVAKLNIESERRHRIKHHGDHQQQHEMVFVEKCSGRERRDDRAAAERVLMIGKRGGHANKQAEPAATITEAMPVSEQCDDQGLLFRGQQRDQIDRGNRDRDHSGPCRRGRVLRHWPRPAH